MGFWTSKAIKDHEIDNIVKINKIDSANNDIKQLWLSFLLIDRYNRYQSKCGYR